MQPDERIRIDKTGLAQLYSLLAPDRLTQIVDIGANPINPTPYAPLIDAQLARVWGFEPQRAAYEELLKMQTPYMSFLPYAIGDGAIHELKVCEGTGFTSLLEPDKAFCDYLNHFKIKMRVKKRVPLQTRRLDDVAELPQVDLVKIDIQGGEVTAFENAPRTLEHTLAVISEVAFIPLYEDQPLLDDQMRTLRENGFQFHKLMPHRGVPLRGPLQQRVGVEQLRNQLTDADAVFLRDVSPDTTLSSEALKHLAMLAAGAFDSPDVSLRCLEVLLSRGVLNAEEVDPWVAKLVPQRSQ